MNTSEEGENKMSENVKESEAKEETSESIIFDAMKTEYEHCVQRAGKLDNKVYILLTVCAFVFVLITNLIEKVKDFCLPQNMTEESLVIVYWLLIIVDVVIFCVVLVKLVVLLGSIKFERLDIGDVLENNIIEERPKTSVKYIGARYWKCIDNNHAILERQYEKLNFCVIGLVLNVTISLVLSFVCVFISMN